ncbi:hypothetical protein [Nocardia carnea]|uniref:hypothetical protein n=1 Tax=Nocardia carnea TaxID=37328 RepID=UPI0024590837|nr:hypothetical protein [Nocardia carnea]
MTGPLNDPGYHALPPPSGYAAPPGLSPRAPHNGTALAAAIIGMVGGIAASGLAVNAYFAWRDYAERVDNLNDGTPMSVALDPTPFVYVPVFAVLGVLLLTGSGLLFARTQLGRVLLIFGGAVGALAAFVPVVRVAGEIDGVPELDILLLQLFVSASAAFGPAAAAVLAAQPATGRWIAARPR